MTIALCDPREIAPGVAPNAAVSARVPRLDPPQRHAATVLPVHADEAAPPRRPTVRDQPQRPDSSTPDAPATGDRRDDVTRLLGELRLRPQAADELLSLVYDRLHQIARRRMANERTGHTLQATALVHEACARLLAPSGTAWESRLHFFRVAAEAMRRILIDHARKRNAERRGGGARSVPIDSLDLAVEHDPESVLALEEALRTLEAEDPRAAEIVGLRFYAGRSVEECAAMLGTSRRTILRDWAFARARLFELIQGRDSQPGQSAGDVEAAPRPVRDGRDERQS